MNKIQSICVPALKKDGDHPTDLGHREITDIDSTDLHDTLLGIVETAQELEEGAFAGTVDPEQCGRGAGRKLDVKTIEDLERRAGEGEVNLTELPDDELLQLVSLDLNRATL